MLSHDDQKSCSPQSPVQTTKVPTARNNSKPGHESVSQGPRKTKPSAQTTATPTRIKDSGPLAKKHEGSSTNYRPITAGVSVGVIVGIFLLVGAILCWRRRAKMVDRSILFYKDNSSTPLHNDFDEDLIKSHDDIAGNSRVQFT